MRIEDNKIEYRQLIFSVACFLQCISIHVSVLINNAREASWLIVILSVLMGVIGSLIIAGLCSIYGRRNLHDMLNLSVGKLIGTIVAIAYICFFFWKLCDSLFELTSFMQIAILPKTPGWLIEFLLILTCAMAAKEGVSVFCSMGFVFTVTTLFFSIVSFLLLIPQFDIQNFLPVFSNDFSAYAKSFFVSSAEPFGDIIAFLMIIPFVRHGEKNKKLTKALTWGVVLGSLTFLLGVIRDISVFGVFAKFFTFPSFESIRLIDLGEIFSRVEIFYVVLYTFLTFFKSTVWLFALAELIKSVVYGAKTKHTDRDGFTPVTNPSLDTGNDKSKQVNFVYFAALMAFIATTLGSDRVLNGVYMDFKINVTISWIFSYIIPAIMLTIGFVKNTVKLYKKNA